MTIFDCRPVVTDFAMLMEAQLRKNDHKGGWSHEPKEYFLKRLREEMIEAEAALQDPDVDFNALNKEFVDLANFAMMVVDNFGGR